MCNEGQMHVLSEPPVAQASVTLQGLYIQGVALFQKLFDHRHHFKV